MQISALKENKNESRVALTPDSIKLFQKFDLEILIEEGAGIKSGYPDQQYRDLGVKIVSKEKCLNADICLCVKIPEIEVLAKLKLMVNI